MSEQEAEQQVQAPENGSAPRSVLDEIRELREKRLTESARRLDLDIPGYGGRVAVLYRYPEVGFDRYEKAVDRERKGGPARIEACCEQLVIACAGVVGRDESGRIVDPLTAKPIGEGDPENVLSFEDFARRVGVAIPPEVKAPSRYAVRALFSPRGQDTGVYEGDPALITQSNLVFAWMNGAEIRDTDEQLLGE